MRLFVTGTDTEVGKSVVTAALAAALRHRGGVVALKPLATGGPPPGEDATLIGESAGHPPQVFRTALEAAAPDRAFRQAGEPPPDRDALLAWIRGFEQPQPHLLVEGVGGWTVPLGGGLRVSALAAALGYPVLVVAANRLGVLNHTLLTVEAIQQQGLPVAGVVLNDLHASTTPAPLRAWNAADLASELPGVPLVRLPALAIPEGLRAAGEAILRTLVP